ncbi:MAG TPA: XRE family transcriptional regulator [Marmoricola sp.]|nr:XRE family transcriptional regulator [Marmoricola sp.]
MTATDLASTLQVDPKTVERWISNGRVPHQRHRVATAKALAVEPAYLWPEVANQNNVPSAGGGELLAVYPTRSAVPASVWRRLIDEARANVDVLVYSGLFLLDTHPDLPHKLVERAASGLQTRFLYGNPDAENVAQRGRDEGIDEGLAARIRIALTYMSPASATDGIEVRQHETVLYNSLYRFDQELLVNTHTAGMPASQSPVLHLMQADGAPLFDHYLRSFEWVWQRALPVDPAKAPMTP